MAESKQNLIRVLRILEEYSDENHILPRGKIEEKLTELYDWTPDKRTVRTAIEALQELGYEISDYNDNGKGYWLMERKFSIAEIRLLIDAVYSCEYISQRQTEELLEKLRSFLSVYDRKNFNYANIITPEKKSPNKEVFLNIEILESAINERRQISFTYMDYDYDKKLVPRRERPYVASPYAMLCEGNRYYLVLIYQGHTDPSFYRIDMMKDIRILDDKIEISKRDANLGSVQKVVFAHSGEPKSVTLRCDKSALRYVIEEFGKDIIITKNEDGSFDAVVRTATEGLIYWALQYMQIVEVVSPKETRDRIIKAIKENKYGV